MAAYSLWGFFPLFWRNLSEVAPLEVVCHRVIWSTVFLAATIVGLRCSGARGAREIAGGWRSESFRIPLKPDRLWLISAAAAVVISGNWLAFVWAVSAGRILESALGYYISPLVSVALGVTVLRERLSRWQWAAIVTAFIGVAWISVYHGSVPWAALTMAATFAVYGLLKKFSPMPSLVGLLMENALLVLPALAYLVLYGESVSVVPPAGDALLWALLITGGVITVPPLMCFAIAARRIPLTTIGILQFIGPTLQLLVGVGIAGETLLDGRLGGFACVWLGCLAYAWSLFQTRVKPIAVTRWS